MATILRDAPCLSITAVAKDRLPVFRTELIKAVTCAALDEARQSGGFLLFAYVIMPDHIHVVTDGALKPSNTLRFAKGIISRRVIGYLKEGDHRVSLEKLRVGMNSKGHQYTLWEHHSNVMLLTSESTFMQRVNYIHQNPVRARLAERAEDYRWSSFRCWANRVLADEPLLMDLDQTVWRTPR